MDAKWTYVSYRRKKGHGQIGNKTDRYEDITNCYFTNFLEDIQIEDIEKAFSRYGDLVDVFIPRKRNKYGKLFGFARFIGVTDKGWLEDHLRNIWFGTYKIWANISRF
jgi:RNA recognition motif-containing protein